MKSVAVIGSGGGGLASAAILAKNGYRVTLLEWDRYIGGAARTTQYDGYWLDEGIHYLVDIENTEMHVNDLGKVVGVMPEIYTLKGVQSAVIKNGEEIDVVKLWPGAMIYDRATALRVFSDYTEAEMEEIETFARMMGTEMMLAIAQLGEFKSFDDIITSLPYIPLVDWMRERTQNQRVIDWILNLASIVILIPPSSVATCSTYQVLALFMGLAGGMFKYCYPTHPEYGGFSALLEPYADIIREHGGEIRFGARAKQVLFKNGKATGVLVEKDGREETLKADIVICNVSPQASQRQGLVDLNVFGADYKADTLDRITRLEKGAERYAVDTLNVYVALKKPLTISESYNLIVDDKGVPKAGMQIYTGYAPASGPVGKQLIYMTNYYVPRNYAAAEDYLSSEILPALRAWLPGFDDNVDWIMSQFGPVRYAQLNQQMFSDGVAFESATPVDNFFWVGMYTGLVGVDGAMITGLHVCEKILGKELMSHA